MRHKELYKDVEIKRFTALETVEYLKPMEGVNREEYLKQAGRMIDALQQKEARKAVLARGIVV